MSILGTNLAQSVAGLNQAERTAVSEADRKRTAKPLEPKRVHDEVMLADAVDAVRNLKGNDQEETQEDRRAHDGYGTAPRGKADGAEHPHIDVQG